MTLRRKFSVYPLTHLQTNKAVFGGKHNAQKRIKIAKRGKVCKRKTVERNKVEAKTIKKSIATEIPMLEVRAIFLCLTETKLSGTRRVIRNDIDIARSNIDIARHNNIFL